MNVGKCLVGALCGGLLLGACHRHYEEPPCTNLPVGATEQTLVVQQALAGRRFEVKTLDGKMNSETVAALRSFQNYMRLPESGQIDAQTLQALGFCPPGSGNSSDSGNSNNSGNIASDDCVEFPSDRREQLRVVQEMLNEEGYDPGPANGGMGKKTREALKQFQADEGLSETGKVDAATREALGFCGESTGDESTSDEPAAAPRKQPVSNPQLQEAQRLLAARGYDPGTADGMMGKKTREALKRFQTDNNLLVSGTDDAKTLGVLRSSSESSEAGLPSPPAPAPASPENSSGQASPEGAK